jgi:hypothetical protein
VLNLSPRIHFSGTYIVEASDSLLSIVQAHVISLDILTAAHSQLNESAGLSIGQKLTLAVRINDQE